MIQDIAPKTYDNTYRPDRTPLACDIAMVFSGEELLVRVTGEDGENADAPRYALLTCEELSARFPGAKAGGQFLFCIDDTSYYYYDFAALSEGSELPADCLLLTVRRFRSEGRCERHVSFAAFTALHLCRWYQENRYCGSCGTKTRFAKEERALDCPSCGRRLYPRIAPAVIVGITNGDEILLTRYANRYHSYHALVAGYNEIGETLEDTVRREVMEEVGLRVKNIRYYKSQPWGIAGDLLSGYFCDVDGDTMIRMDETELKEAVWVKRAEVDGQPDDYSLTNEMMMLFKAGKEPV